MTSSALPLSIVPTFPGRNAGLFHPRPGKQNAGLNAFHRRLKMGKKLYVGNLSYETSSSDLEKLFSAHGTVQSAEVIMDRETGRSKGFGFVEMGSDQEAQAAISALDGKDQGG